jgi:hypothetical protein
MNNGQAAKCGLSGPEKDDYSPICHISVLGERIPMTKQSLKINSWSLKQTD